MKTLEKTTTTTTIAQLIKPQLAISQINWVSELRALAFDNFTTLGIPTRRNEEYKYSPVEPLFKGDMTIAQASTPLLSDIPNVLFGKTDAHVVVTVNGYYNEALTTQSSKEKLIICNFKEAFVNHADVLQKHFNSLSPNTTDALAALNTAAFTSGVFVLVKAYEHITQPIYILNITTGNAPQLINARNLIVVEGNALCHIIEHNVSHNLNAKAIRNSVTEIIVGENTEVKHEHLQNDNELLNTINATCVSQERTSTFTSNVITLGGNYTRNNLHVSLNNNNCTTHLNGLFMPSGSQLIDNHTTVDHAMPHCNSNELYKGILMDKSTGVFNGKIFVRKDAQKTNAYQSSKNILLSADATINTKPQLEIYADDVKCSHGTTTGQIDDEAIFYLQARGIGKESAKRIMMHAFASEVIDHIQNISLRKYVTTCMEQKLWV
ncbi:MAG: Fe-S cluster assembly protein SufD [Bacteroidia bacterium]|nr:Fe-S cluster assembly protein SufD [Bacteroidia bacterium]